MKDYLTNEKLRKKFTNQFELVSYAIKLATNMILTGRDSRVKIDSQNRAMQVLSEILNNEDRFDDIPAPLQDPSLGISDSLNGHNESKYAPHTKMTERKKSRKILVEES